MDTSPQRQPSFSHLVELIDRHVLDLSQGNLDHDNDVWYLLNHLRKVQENAHSSASAKAIAQSVKSLTRFAIDSLEWDGDLIQRVKEIEALHALLLRHEC
jgi:hypothetical protein